MEMQMKSSEVLDPERYDFFFCSVQKPDSREGGEGVKMVKVHLYPLKFHA